MGRGAASGASYPSATAGASTLSVLGKDTPNWLGGAIEQRAWVRRRSSRRRGRRGRHGRRQWLRVVVAPLHAAPRAPVPCPAPVRAVARAVARTASAAATPRRARARARRRDDEQQADEATAQHEATVIGPL